jgi:hypothetical protein
MQYTGIAVIALLVAGPAQADNADKRAIAKIGLVEFNRLSKICANSALYGEKPSHDACRALYCAGIGSGIDLKHCD